MKQLLQVLLAHNLGCQLSSAIPSLSTSQPPLREAHIQSVICTGYGLPAPHPDLGETNFEELSSVRASWRVGWGFPWDSITTQPLLNSPLFLPFWRTFPNKLPAVDLPLRGGFWGIHLGPLLHWLPAVGDGHPLTCHGFLSFHFLYVLTLPFLDKLKQTC